MALRSCKSSRLLVIGSLVFLLSFSESEVLCVQPPKTNNCCFAVTKKLIPFYQRKEDHSKPLQGECKIG